MSGLVAELQRDALDHGVPVSHLLRNALVAARKLRVNEFSSWIDTELNGYPKPKEDAGVRTKDKRFSLKVKQEHGGDSLVEDVGKAIIWGPDSHLPVSIEPNKSIERTGLRPAALAPNVRPHTPGSGQFPPRW